MSTVALETFEAAGVVIYVAEDATASAYARLKHSAAQPLALRAPLRVGSRQELHRRMDAKGATIGTAASVG